jgi:hypothetical protein
MIVFKGGTLIDGTGAAPVRDTAVVVRDGRVDAVTTAGAVTWPKDAEIVDVSGRTVLPGLIDCHDHMALHGYDLARRWSLDEPASTRSLRTAQAIQQTLAQGYTAVRDAGGLDAGFRQAVWRGGDPRTTAPACGHLHIGIGITPRRPATSAPATPDLLPLGVARGWRTCGTSCGRWSRRATDRRCAPPAGPARGNTGGDAAFTRTTVEGARDEGTRWIAGSCATPSAAAGCASRSRLASTPSSMAATLRRIPS